MTRLVAEAPGKTAASRADKKDGRAEQTAECFFPGAAPLAALTWKSLKDSLPNVKLCM